MQQDENAALENCNCHNSFTLASVPRFSLIIIIIIVLDDVVVRKVQVCVCIYIFIAGNSLGKIGGGAIAEKRAEMASVGGKYNTFSPLISLQPGQTTDGNMFCQCSSGAFNPCQPRLTHSLRPRPPLWLLQLLLSGSCRSSSSADCQFDCHRIAIAPKEQSISVKSLYIFSFFFFCVFLAHTHSVSSGRWLSCCRYDSNCYCLAWIRKG